MNKVIVQSGQNIGDIAIQYCGDHEAIFEIAALNEISVTDDVAAGTELLIPEVYDKRVRRFYVEGNYYPATSAENLLDGIDFMGIEINFLVR